ncbi:hypothetical protein DIPPA_06099 [Diplonema papillatum]|nr:hypothetical protein DIPPA_06099 [Diplonema papillatum]
MSPSRTVGAFALAWSVASFCEATLSPPTAPPSTPPPVTSSAALACTAVASSSEGPFVAANVCDGNSGTRWGSFFNDDEWIYVDVGSIKRLERVALSWETAYGYSYDIRVSNDASTWTTSLLVTGSIGGVDELNLPAGTEGRYVAMFGNTRGIGYGYSLFSFDVFAASTSGPTVAPPRNLAANRPAVASSMEGQWRLAAEYAVDGDMGTRWSSAHTDGDEWIYVDLGSSMTVSRVVLYFETAYATAYHVQVSDDAVAWTTVFSEADGDGGVATIELLSRPQARYVRFLGKTRKTRYGYSLWEIEMY